MDRPGLDLDDWADWIMSIYVDLEKMESITRDEQPQPSLTPQYWEPRLLKLGPYHANDEDSHCKQMKRRVFLYSLKKYGKPMEAYVAALHGMAQNLKNAYEELDPLYFQTDRDFLILMIVDGCVLVETLRELRELSREGPYNWDHPLWDVDGSSRTDLVENYKHDMMLLGGV
ncbi:hypothetical protein CDL12_30146 [Handroanthus impetiginosus]|uniref:Uncharacterized protein n=1 Tax=Handroanthus impetiginosus TaxID=429701 RepID=A0A2G9FWW8_9LAMI|nr:hypothetical protein CDL12_30146 [Handroanthus impetiginosus]